MAHSAGCCTYLTLACGKDKGPDMRSKRSAAHIEGHVNTGFEAVRDAFAEDFLLRQELKEKGTELFSNTMGRNK